MVSLNATPALKIVLDTPSGPLFARPRPVRLTRPASFSFDKALEAERSHAYAIAYRFTGNDDKAQEAVQEAMYRAWRSRDTYDTSQPFARWFAVIVKNICFEMRRTARRHPEDTSVETLTPYMESRAVGRLGCAEGAAETEGDALTASERARYRQELLFMARFALTPYERRIMEMRYVQGLDFAEIALIVGAKASAIRMTVKRALLRLHTPAQVLLAA